MDVTARCQDGPERCPDSRNGGEALSRSPPTDRSGEASGPRGYQLAAGAITGAYAMIAMDLTWPSENPQLTIAPPP